MAALIAHRLSPALFSRTLPLQLRTMSTAAKMHHIHAYLAVVPDREDVKLDMRLRARTQHLIDLEKKRVSGGWKMGGALLRDVAPTSDPETWDFHGSTLIIEAKSREDVLEQLKSDIYAKAGVWDVEKAQIFPFKAAFGLDKK